MLMQEADALESDSKTRKAPEQAETLAEQISEMQGTEYEVSPSPWRAPEARIW